MHCWQDDEIDELVEVPELEDAQQIAVAGDLACAVREDGTVAWCGAASALLPPWGLRSSPSPSQDSVALGLGDVPNLSGLARPKLVRRLLDRTRALGPGVQRYRRFGGLVPGGHNRRPRSTLLQPLRLASRGRGRPALTRRSVAASRPGAVRTGLGQPASQRGASHLRARREPPRRRAYGTAAAKIGSQRRAAPSSQAGDTTPRRWDTRQLGSRYQGTSR